MKDTVKIEMTVEQQEWLLRRLRIDWDEEVNYQKSNGESDTSYLEMLKDCFIALLGKATTFIDKLVVEDILDGFNKDIESIKELDKLYKDN